MRVSLSCWNTVAKQCNYHLKGRLENKKKMETEINWREIRDKKKLKQFWIDLLQKLPRTSWSNRDEYGNTLLHYAVECDSIEVVKVLSNHSLINTRGNHLRTPTHIAATSANIQSLETLCAMGADLRVKDRFGDTPIDDAIRMSTFCLYSTKLNRTCCIHLLLANGVRLKTSRERITPEMILFERGVLQCRAAVIAMIRVKKASKKAKSFSTDMDRWDRFLLREMAIKIWATRYDIKWQSIGKNKK